MEAYVLVERGVDSPFAAEFQSISTSVTGEAPRCPQCGQYLGGLEWLPPYRVDIEVWGEGPGDLCFGIEDSFLVSQRFAGCFKADGLTGLSGFEPVEVRRVKNRYNRVKHRPPPYFKVNIARDHACIDQERSGFDWETPPTCSVCRVGRVIKRWRGLFLEPGALPATDVFRARGLRAILVNERFKDFCDRRGITNAVLVPAATYNRDFYPWENTKRAEELARMAVGGDLEEKVTSKGEVWRYYRPNNELLILNADRSIRELLRPVGGRSFWENAK